MREFVYYSKNAVTAGNMIKGDLMKAGRMDIVCNVVIQAFFVSNAMRKDVKLHLIFDGPPYGTRHLILDSGRIEEETVSKKDIAGLIKRMLYKCDEEKKVRVFPGCFIEKKSFEAVVKELDSGGKNVFLLDEKGKDIRDLKFEGNEVFILGDQEGFPRDKQKLLKRIDKISVSPRVLFASQVVTLVNNEIDRKL